MRNKLKKIVVKKYSMRYYIDLLFETSLWNTPEKGVSGVRHQCGQLNVNLRQVPAQVND